MIKFFRNIRKSLLTENRVSKYLLYAFGEIILVVIGILIALQINNWNEDKKNRNQEALYLHRLLKESEKNVSIFTNEIARLEKNNNTIKELSNKLKEKKSTDKQLIKSASDYMISGSLYPIFNPSTSTYKDLSSTGNLSLIKDTELREQIVKQYENFEFVESNFKINIDWAIPIDSPLFVNTNALQFDTKFTSFLFPDETTTQLANQLRQNKTTFLRTAALHYWINEDCISYLKMMNKEVSLLITTLKNKLKEYD